MYVGRVGIKGVVGVIGGSDSTFEADGLAGSKDQVLAAAKELGQKLARLQSVHLLTGGGGGVMKAVSEGFYVVHPRSGIILGVIPKGKKTDEYPNAFVEIPIFTHLPGSDPLGTDSRNHINILTSDVIVVMSGGAGTMSELELATKAKYKYNKPAIVYLPDAADTVAGKNAAALKRAKYTVTDNLDEVLAFVKESLTTTER